MNKLEGLPTPNIINLRECVDRKEYIINEFKKYGVDDVVVHTYDRWHENSDVKFIGNQQAIYDTPKGVTSSHLLTIKRWLETTDEEFGVFFEDDVDLSTINFWNFTFKEFIDRLGSRWECFHMCGIFESLVSLVPRMRESYDFGLQAYAMKRKYARKLVKYYFTEDDPKTINFRMPHGCPKSTENNVLGAFGTTYTFPLFNHNIGFDSKNHHTTIGEQLPTAIYAAGIVKKLWEDDLRESDLEHVFDHFRVAHLNIRYEKIRYEQ